MSKNNEASLSTLLERGGVYYNIPGAKPREILTCLSEALPDLPALDKTELLKAVLERESLMPTALGRGIALPHPRSSVLGAGGEPFMAVAFPALPVDWEALDGKEVDTVILIVSASSKQHLNTLSKITFLCQQEKIYSLLEARAAPEEIIAALKEAENSWE
ncbi:MAG: PTS sugar transporter subunit IIA [Treponema sp.]|jgi:mannitol/fructose-specific phosphotransferase system IIA component (Ntr-type)|nr:PTS sugar transporter subunit IIA [Treponema sp.]